MSCHGVWRTRLWVSPIRNLATWFVAATARRRSQRDSRKIQVIGEVDVRRQGSLLCWDSWVHSSAMRMVEKLLLS